MVLLAAAVCSKAGKAIISRQFVEMSKARIEGLLAAFPKLLSTGKQHTFVETESVRYVYQPMDKLYMLLITTKASNILEDLETLRLFSRVILEYCKAVEESEITENAFNLIFAFDEIVALGYRESVNLAQIRTFVEMDSHEEKVYQAVRQTQEREAKNKMREKAKELQRARQEAAKKGLKSPTNSFGSGSMGGYSPTSPVNEITPTEPTTKSLYAPSKAPATTGKAMKLRTGNKDVDSFVDQLKSEGVQIISNADSTKSSGPISSKASTPVDTESVHLKLEEKLTLTARRDGGVQDMELHGIISLRITDDTWGRIKINVENLDDKGIQIQTHPNIDRELFRSQCVVALKNPSKPFPLHSEVGVLKWRFQTSDSAFMPLSINCWPSENGSNKCDINIEYELQLDKMELEDVTISIPLMSGSGNPMVSDCDGEYHYESRKNCLEWRIPVIDSSNKNGSMEFSCNGRPNDFFPVTVSFISTKPYSDLRILGLQMVDDGAPVKYSSETVLRVEKYEVV